MYTSLKMLRNALVVVTGITLMAAPALADEFKVAIALPGPITDNGWNQTGYEGIMAAEKNLGVTASYSEQVAQPDHAEVLADYARRGYKLIFAHGGEFESAVFRVAQRFPDVTFAVTNGDKAGGNVAMIEHDFRQFGYLLGYLGGKMTKSGTAGYLCGEKIKICTDFEDSFIMGFSAAYPDGKVLVTYTNDWQDVAKAKQAAVLQASQGADVILPILDNGVLGVFQAAKEKGAWAFGIYADFYQDFPDVTLQSALMDISSAIVEFAKTTKQGGAEGKVYSYDLGSGAAGLGTYHPNVPQNVRDEVAKIMADLESGKIRP
jgi:basic membrane protein A